MHIFTQIRPILSALLHNSIGALLIALQSAFTLAIVINAAFIIAQRIEKMNRPTGIDIDNIITLTSQGFSEDFNEEVVTQEDLRILRSLPGVINATPIQAFPLSGSGWSSGYTNSMEEGANKTSVAMYFVDDQAMDTLGIKLKSGRNFRPEEISFYGLDNNQIDSMVLITQPAADKIYPDGDAVGKPLYSGNGSVATIIGIIEHMHGSWVGWEGLDRVMLIPKYMHNKYLVRAEPGALDSLIPTIEETLIASNRERLIRAVRPLNFYVKNSYGGDKAMSIILAAVIFLLIVVASLGIVSLATVNVSRRTRQIGTRRALGATRTDILGYFLIENWLITTMGIVIGCAMGIGFNYWLVTSFELPRLEWYYVAFGIIALWALGLISVFAPARKASLVSPALATRNL